MGKNGSRKASVEHGATPGVVEKKKKWGTKHVLHSPFATNFPLALAGTTDTVCRELRSVFPCSPFYRSRVSGEEQYRTKSECYASTVSGRDQESEKPSFSKSLSAGGTERLVTSEGMTSGCQLGQTGEVDSSDEESHSNSGRRRRAPASGKPPWLFVGVNEVTKGLEKGCTTLVVVARDVSPPILVAHLPALCFLRDASLVVCSGGGSEIAKVFGLKRVLAFGLSTCSGDGVKFPEAEKLYSSVAHLATKLHYPWLAAAKRKEPPASLPEPVLRPPSKLI